MKSTNKVITLIDNFRRLNDVTIDSLIEGITSDRSYRRYLNGEQEATIELTHQLAERLNMNVFDLIRYIPKDTTETDFIENTILNTFNQTKTNKLKSYETLKNKNYRGESLNRFVEFLLKRNAKDIGVVSLKEYEEYLDQLKSDLNMQTSKSPISIIIWLFILEDSFEQKKYDAISIEIENMLQDNKHLGITIFSSLLYLRISYHNNITTYKKLYDIAFKLEEFTVLNPLIVQRSSSVFYLAYYAYMTDNNDEFEEYLFSFLQGLDYVVDTKTKIEIYNEIEEKTNIIIKKFLQDKTEFYLTQKGYNLS